MYSCAEEEGKGPEDGGKEWYSGLERERAPEGRRRWRTAPRTTLGGKAREKAAQDPWRRLVLLRGLNVDSNGPLSPSCVTSAVPADRVLLGRTLCLFMLLLLSPIFTQCLPPAGI